MKSYCFRRVPWLVPLVGLAMTITIVGPILAPRAFGWGSLQEGSIAGNRNTHVLLDAAAWDAINARVNIVRLGTFPSITGIARYDVLRANTSGHLPGSTSPDYEDVTQGDGPVTIFSWHYGDGHISAQFYYNKLVDGLKARSSERLRYAAWTAHFVSDQYVPYHTLGVRFTGQSEAALDAIFTNWNDDVEDFLALASNNPTAYNWYDPSYWDHYTTQARCTHLWWEGWNHPDSVAQPTAVDPLWVGTNPKDTRIDTFVAAVAGRTATDFQTLVDNPATAMGNAAAGIYTVWRDSFSAMQLQLNVLGSGNPGTFKVSAVVRNHARLAAARNVRVKIILPAGLNLVSPAADTQEIPDIAANDASDPVFWEVGGSVPGCPEIKVQLTGGYDDQPDLAQTEDGAVEAVTKIPPVVRITAPAEGSTNTSMKVTVQGEINDPQCTCKLDVNGVEVWISKEYNTGASFSKEVDIKAGANKITAYAVNRCGKSGNAAVTFTGGFTNPAIKAVLSWDVNNTDVDLHLVDSNGGSECMYNNKTPNWGDPGTAEDDPALDIDNTTGYGPETMILRRPKAGSYTVRVVYYSDHNSEQDIATIATVKIYKDGEFVQQFSRSMINNGNEKSSWDVYTYTFSESRSRKALDTAATASLPTNYTVSEFLVTTNAAAQASPQIYNGRIVWVDQRNAPHRLLRYYDIATGVEAPVSPTNFNSGEFEALVGQVGPAIGANGIVWRDTRYMTPAIWRFNDGAESFLWAVTNFGESDLAFAGNRIVWEDARNSTGETDNADIFLYDLGTGQEYQLTTNTAAQLAPDISGTRVVWTDVRQGDYTIYMRDLAANVERQIAPCSSDGFNAPAIDGDYIVWEDGRNGQADIYLYDLSANEERRLTTSSAEQSNPDVQGKRVVWVDYRNGNPDIYLYDIQTRREVAVCTNASPQFDPVVYGDYVVWVDQRNGNSDIYAACVTVPTPSLTLPVFFPGMVHAYLYDNTQAQWVNFTGGGQLNAPTQIVVPNVQKNQYYWLGIFDYATGSWAHGQWFARIDTSPSGRFIGHVLSTGGSPYVGLPVDVVEIASSAGHTLWPVTVDLTTWAWDYTLPQFLSDGTYTYQVKTWSPWSWLVFYDLNAGAWY